MTPEEFDRAVQQGAEFHQRMKRQREKGQYILVKESRRLVVDSTMAVDAVEAMDRYSKWYPGFKQLGFAVYVKVGGQG